MRKLSNKYARILIGSGLIITALFAIVNFFNMRDTLATVDKYYGVPESLKAFKGDFKVTLPNNLTAKQRLICEGDKTQKQPHLQWQALHDAYPFNKVYLAKYMNAYIKELGSCLRYLNEKNYKEIMRDPKQKNELFTQRQKYLELLNNAEKIDPDNALYNYLKAVTLFSEAFVDIYNNEEYTSMNSENTANKTIKKEKTQPFGTILNKVVDEQKMIEALKEYQKGLAKPYYKIYNTDLAQQQIAILYPHPKSVNDFFHKLSIDCDNLGIPYLGMMRELARYVREAIIYDYEQKKYTECEKLIATRNVLIPQQLTDNKTLIGHLVISAIDGILLGVAQEYYTARNNPQLANVFKEKIKQAKAIRRPTREEEFSKKYQKNSGMIVMSIMVFCSFFESEKEFKEKLYPENIVEYKLLEQVFLMALSGVLFIILLILALSIKLFMNDTEYIKLDKRDYLRLVSFSIVLPLVVYLTITNIDILSGRELNIKQNYSSFPLQLMVFGILMLSTLECTARFIACRYCCEQNIAAPNNKIAYWGMAISYLILIGLTILRLQNYFLIAGIILIPIMFSIGLLTYEGLVKKKYSHYFKLLYKNLLLYCAVFPIIAMLVLFVVVKYQEYYYIEKDEFFFAKTSKGESFTPLEMRTTKKLNELYKKEILDK